MSRPVPLDRVEAVRRLIEGEGKSFSQVGQLLGITRSSVAGIVRRAGIKTPNEAIGGRVGVFVREEKPRRLDPSPYGSKLNPVVPRRGEDEPAPVLAETLPAIPARAGGSTTLERLAALAERGEQPGRCVWLSGDAPYTRCNAPVAVGPHIADRPTNLCLEHHHRSRVTGSSLSYEAARRKINLAKLQGSRP